MGYESPNVNLIDSSGNSLPVQSGSAIPASTPALLLAGSDGTNSRYITLDTSGRQLMVGAGTAGTPTGGVVSIQGVAGGLSVPISGTVTATSASQTTTGAATPASATLMGGSVTTASPTYTTGTLNALSLTTSGLLRIDGSGVTQPVSGTVTANAGSGNFAVVQATAANLNATVVQPTAANLNATVVGSGNFTVVQATAANLRAQTAAESATGATPPAAAVYIGGSVTTAAPTYTTGQMNALSLTTSGLLRVDTSGTTSPISGTVTANQGGTWTVQPGNTANTTPWLTTINQGGNSAAVKAASTAAVATDSALVVAISPNNSLNIGQVDISTSGSLGALNAVVTITPSGKYTIGGQILGTWVGTITPEGTIDGTTWFTVRTANKSTNDIINAYTANDAFEFYSVAGCIGLRLRMSAYTSGTATIVLTGTSLATDAFLNYSGTTADTGPPLRHVSIGTLTNDNTSFHALYNTDTTPLGTEFALITRSIQYGEGINSSYPDPNSFDTGAPQPINVDSFGNLQTRGTVLTDEQSLRDDFTGTTLTTTLTGTVTFTAASATVTGAGTTFTTQVDIGQYIKKTADAETLYLQVASVDSDTSLTLVAAYAGTTAATTAVVSNWQTVTPTGGSLTVVNSIFTLAAGTTAAATGSIRSFGDYLPFSVQFNANLSQRIANNTFILGFVDSPTTPAQQAVVQFTGTVNTTVNFITSYSTQATDIQTTAATIPNAGTTATSHFYKIDLSQNQATLSIDGVVVATNLLHLPTPYTPLYVVAKSTNGAAPATSTSLNIDNIFFQNVDRIQIDHDFIGEPIPSRLTDGTNSVAVKAASTAAVATDPSLVVAFSPNSPLPAGTNTIGNVGLIGLAFPFQDNITQFGGTNVSTGTGGSGAGIPRVTVANDSQVIVQGSAAAGAAVSGNPLLVAGFDGVNVATLRTVSASGINALGVASQGMGANGAAVNGNPVLVAGYDGTTTRTLKTGTDGTLLTASVDSTKASYSSSTIGLTVAATPTDVFTISGSATKIIRILRVFFTGTQTTAATRDVYLIKRSTADTGGTSSTLANTSHDSTNAAGTAVVRAYTVNPTALGTSVGTVRGRKVFIPAPATAANIDELGYFFGDKNDQSIVLRGVAESLCVNLNSASSAGSSLNIFVEWTEE